VIVPVPEDKTGIVLEHTWPELAGNAKVIGDAKMLVQQGVNVNVPPARPTEPTKV